MYCHTSSSVQFDSGNTRIDSPARELGVVERATAPDAVAAGPTRDPAARNEKMRSFARLVLLVAARTADCRIEPVTIERLLQRVGLHDLRV